MQRARLLYVVTEDWYFLSHRLPMARAARDAGFEVHVATRVGRGAAKIASEGFVVHDVPFARGRLSPLAAFETVRALRAIHRAVRPAICHHVSLQPAVFGSLAALDRDAICVNAVTGFGFAFTSSAAKARLVRPVLGQALRYLLHHRDNVVLVQNPDDRETLLGLGIPDARIVTIAGSGVDLARFSPAAEPSGPVTIGFAGRLLEDKGVHTLVDAHARLHARGSAVRLEIAGAPDPANPSCVAAATLDRWRRLPGVTIHGHVDDMARFWQGVHVAVLPSRREGLPKSLIEAAACGRPMIASDVPGCREVVAHDETGLLVPVDDAGALAAAIERLASSRELRARYGGEARRSAERRFGSELIATQIATLYSRLSGGRPSRDAA